MYDTISRDQVPAGSFKYGQLASIESFDVSPEAWAVCLPCSKPNNEADNGRSGFHEVLVAHFIYSDEQDARETAKSLSEGKDSYRVTLVQPA